MQSGKSNKGFTLIELIIVIFILIMLFSIVRGCFKKVVERDEENNQPEQSVYVQVKKVPPLTWDQNDDADDPNERVIPKDVTERVASSNKTILIQECQNAFKVVKVEDSIYYICEYEEFDDKYTPIRCD